MIQIKLRLDSSLLHDWCCVVVSCRSSLSSLFLLPLLDSLFSAAALSSVPASSFDYVVSRSASALPAALLPSVLSSLKSGGSLVVSLPVESSSAQSESDLVLGGFVDVAVRKGASRVEIVAQRPAWDVNSAAPLKLKKKAAPAPAPAKKGQQTHTHATEVRRTNHAHSNSGGLTDT